MTTKTLKTFIIKGWVETEVYAEVKATSKKALLKEKKEYEAKYGVGNGGQYAYQGENWVSPVHITSIEELKTN